MTKQYYQDNKEKISARSSKHYYENRDKILAQRKEYRLNNLDKTRRAARNSRYKLLYNITLKEYEALLKKQDERCAICKKPSKYGRLHVDHNHTTGISRGLLCFACNSGLGKFEDSLEVIQKAILYLEEYESQGVSKC